MLKKSKLIFNSIGAVAGVFLVLTQCTDSSLNIVDKYLKHEEPTEICARGEVVVIKAKSQSGQALGTKLAQRLGSNCRVHGPMAPSSPTISISNDEIKYFHHEDKSKAESLSNIALECCKAKATVKYLPEFSRKDEERYHRGYLEVWFQ